MNSYLLFFTPHFSSATHLSRSDWAVSYGQTRNRRTRPNLCGSGTQTEAPRSSIPAVGAFDGEFDSRRRVWTPLSRDSLTCEAIYAHEHFLRVFKRTLNPQYLFPERNPYHFCRRSSWRSHQANPSNGTNSSSIERVASIATLAQLCVCMVPWLGLSLA